MAAVSRTTQSSVRARERQVEVQGWRENLWSMKRQFLPLTALTLILLLLVVAGPAPAAHASDFGITSTTDAPDANPGDGICASESSGCTLRAAVEEANALAGKDTLYVSSGTYTLTLGVVEVTDELDIVGETENRPIIDGNDNDRVFFVTDTTVTLQLFNLIIQNGQRTGSSAAGGAILSYGNLVVSNSELRDNSTSSDGGAIFANGTLIVRGSTITGNSSGTSGGGIAATGATDIHQSAITSNTAVLEGGGLMVLGDNLFLTSSTVSGNSSDEGGGIYVSEGSVQLLYVTLANNAAMGGASHNGGNLDFEGVSSQSRIDGTIIADPASGPNCSGASNIDGDNNLASDASCGLNGLTSTDPLLDPLASNGGPTETHALGAGSPAIDAGGAACPDLDQRGEPRPTDGDASGSFECDAGAFEGSGDTAPDQGVLHFTETSYSVSEGTVSVTISVARSVGNSGAVSVQYDTNPGSATLGEDYTTSTGTLEWADSDGAVKEFTVPLTDDMIDEPSESFAVTLSNPGGGAIVGGASAVTVTIHDDDGAGVALVVDSQADEVDANPGDGICAGASGSCTLRAAIMETNATLAADTIQLPSGVYTLTLVGCNEGIGSDDLNAACQDLDITNDLAVTGAGAGTTVVTVPDGIGITHRILHVGDLAEVTLTGFTVWGGFSAGGGGIRLIDAILTLNEIVVSGNSGPGVGGGSYAVLAAGSSAQLTVYNSVISDNNATGLSVASGSATVIRTTISGNHSNDPKGSGIANAGVLTVSESLITGNNSSFGEREQGGGLYNNGTATLRNVTISDNAVDGLDDAGGGGITNTNGGTLALLNVTITGNSAATGASIQNESGTVTLKNTIVANGQGGGDNCSGVITSLGHNLEFPGHSCSFEAEGDIVADPKLGPLASNGGPTQTQLLLPGSAAIDAGDNAGCPAIDQRGINRPSDGDGDQVEICDIGAVEEGQPVLYMPSLYSNVASPDR